MSLFKKKVLDMHFDERQERARGKAFQYGFFTLLIAAYAYGISDVLLGRWCDVLTGVYMTPRPRLTADSNAKKVMTVRGFSRRLR